MEGNVQPPMGREDQKAKTQTYQTQWDPILSIYLPSPGACLFVLPGRVDSEGWFPVTK